MKTKLLLMCLCVMPLVGCASSERKKIVTANDSAVLTMELLMEMREQGKIGDEDWAEIKKVVTTLNEILEDWHVFVESGIVGTDMSTKAAMILKKLRTYLESNNG